MNYESDEILVSLYGFIIILSNTNHFIIYCLIHTKGDEAFDFGAMGRIFCGLYQVGAWGCFDKCNRLEEQILSAVSQQILAIQQGLLERQKHIEILGKSICLHESKY